MSATDKVTILLADEDALRRDGLSAVLSGNENFQVISRVPDGESALDQIRGAQPDIAIVDLNLPKLHGIELIRRVRSEALPTKIVILAGTTDDEIIREVVRAGGDGYLLKNGPARHLIDAIGYVRDGGQYFSPQLRRDGRDRHLLEEPPRQYPNGSGGASRAEREPEDLRSREPERTREPERAREKDRRTRLSRPRKNGRRATDVQPFRERIREQAGPSSKNLEDRDYEIMSMMAEGIRPILDRLDEIDTRVAQMEEGDEPVPTNPRGWLTRQLADTLGESRGVELESTRTARDLELRLPEMIEDAVTKRFNQMAGKLQEQIEESHVKTLETFVKNIQVKLVQRVSALEQDMGKQAEAMQQLREYSLRTEDNLSRLISGVDKLAQDLPRRLAVARQEQEQAERVERTEYAERIQRSEQPPITIQAEPAVRYETRETPPPTAAARRPVRRTSQKSGRKPWKTIVSVAAGVAVLVLLVWGLSRVNWSAMGSPAPAASAGNAVPPAAGGLKPPAASADTKTKMQAAQQYSDRKEYAVAEDLYKQVVAAEPNNVDALKGLASVYYREGKVDESAAILDRIPSN
jgi:DNA-binding NarL/FixJ family response regulator/tetratricopeptide (TPR) repeat protein